MGFIHSTPASFSGGFADVEWLAYPWMTSCSAMTVLIPLRPHQRSDSQRRRSGFTGAPFNGPFNSTRNRITPGVQFLIHANIKASFEYQFRPSQSVVIATNPLTGLPVALNPFHTNTAVAGLEFVY